MNNSIFITGIGGFIGEALAKRFATEGRQVSGIDLDTSRFAALEALGIKCFESSLSEASKYVSEESIVINTVAIVKEGGSIENFRQVNVVDTRKLAIESWKKNAKVFVQLSSVMVYGLEFPENITESGPLSGSDNPYCITKIEGEQALQEAAEQMSKELIIIRPGDVYGARSIPWVLRPIQMARKRLFVLPSDIPGVMNHVYIDNLIDAIALAIEQEAYGQVFNITDNQRTSFHRFYELLFMQFNLQPPVYIHSWLLKAAVSIIEPVTNSLGIPLDVNSESLRFVSRGSRYSCEKAMRELNYQPRVALTQGIENTFEEISRGL